MDAAGRLAARTDALGAVQGVGDGLGVDLALRTISVERDQLGQVTNKDVDGEVTIYAYDRAGRLLEAAGPAAELRYQYDRRGLAKTELVDGRPITYAYTPWARRTCRTTPTGHATSYAYGADGQPHRLTTGGRPVEFTHDAAGRELARVTAVHAQGWTERYAYNAAGNQTSASWPSGHPGGEATGSRAYAGTRLNRAGDVRFEYDALGRVTLRQKTRLSRKPDTWRYAWDTENRLTSVTTPDGTRWRYRYTLLGRRTAKQRLAPDGESVVEEVRFTWDGLTLCEQTTLQPDQPNTVALTWDHRGDVPLAQTERIHLHPLRFPGQYYDPKTGLHYNYFRHYDPETGRHTSPGPLGPGSRAEPRSQPEHRFATRLASCPLTRRGG